MRHLICIKTLFLLSVLSVFTYCKKEEQLIDGPLNPVKHLKQPAHQTRIDLKTTGSLQFEWEAAENNGNYKVSYDVVFDKADGDFSQPMQVLTSENQGRNTGLAVKQADLDRIAELAGAESKAEITLSWAVRSKAGEQNVLSEEQRKLTLIRLNKERPQLQEGELLYIGGDGAEAGQQFKSVQTDKGTIYEIYTKIEAGKPYHLYSRLNDTEKLFSLSANGQSFDIASGSTPEGATIDETGVYRLKVDFSTLTISREKIEELTIRMSQTNREKAFEYTEKGCWKLENYNIQLTEEDWGLEERYKLIFYVNGQQEAWGPASNYGDRPSINEEGYRDMAPTSNGQWDGKPFKFPIELCDKDDLSRYFTDITVSMTAEKNYTHDFSDYYFFREEDAKFKNAIFTEFSLPDPDVIRGDDGYFYLYATEHSRSDLNMRNAPIMRSADLMNWERVGSLFTDETHPQITNGNAGIWAPTISKVGNKYTVYYSQPGDNFKHAIGVATADTPTGPFTDHGKLIDSNEQGVDISIDAYLYQEDGRNYLFWGSFREISVIELTADGLSIKPGATRKVVAGGQYEAAYVHKKYGYYYLIVSTGDYSKGGTYRVVVGRSRNVMGPYINKSGKDMIDINHELMLKGDKYFSSPGHSSRIITDDIGNDWILYHAYPNDKNYRCLMLDQVTWENEWPVIHTTYPSSNGYIAPVFN